MNEMVTEKSGNFVSREFSKRRGNSGNIFSRWFIGTLAEQFTWKCMNQRNTDDRVTIHKYSETCRLDHLYNK